jgi:hypothetical protein
LAATYDSALAILLDLEFGQWKELPEAVQGCRVALERCHGLYLLPQRLRRATHRAEDAIQKLRVGAQAALRRSEWFASPPEAAEFAEEWLNRAARRFATRAPTPRVLGGRAYVLLGGGTSREHGRVRAVVR